MFEKIGKEIQPTLEINFNMRNYHKRIELKSNLKNPRLFYD